MATLVGHDERSHRSPLTGCGLIDCTGRLGAGFCEVKLEEKIRDIKGANGSGGCICSFGSAHKKASGRAYKTGRFGALAFRAARVTTLRCSLPTTLSAAHAGDVSIAPAGLKAIGTIDARFQSYNIEMVEVTGGRFWKPISANNARARMSAGSASTATGRRSISPTRGCASWPRRLAPAYLRVSGTWANATFFADTDDAPATPPAGIRRRAEPRPMARRGRLRARGRRGHRHLLRHRARARATPLACGSRRRRSASSTYTHSLGGHIAAAEFMNEPTSRRSGGAPPGYDAAAYGRDFKVFRAFDKQRRARHGDPRPGLGRRARPCAIRVGHHDARSAGRSRARRRSFSYHHYGTVSQRCAGGAAHDAAEDALSEEWLARTDATLAFYRALRDEFEPGKPIWLTETADAACGGNPLGLDLPRHVPLSRPARPPGQGKASRW